MKILHFLNTTFLLFFKIYVGYFHSQKHDMKQSIVTKTGFVRINIMLCILRRKFSQSNVKFKYIYTYISNFDVVSLIVI